MTIQKTKMKSDRLTSYAFLATIILAFTLLIDGARSESDEIHFDTTVRGENHAHAIESVQTSRIDDLLLRDAFLLDETAFSSVECKTPWCRTHTGEPREKRVALNAKYGTWSKVYIPVYDKTYDVIGTTDSKTDLDIWFGDDQETAFDFGRKTLLIKLLK